MKTTVTCSGGCKTRAVPLFLVVILMIPLLGLSLVSTCKGVDNRLAAYWSFDEGSGTTASDSSGNGNTGTLHGGATWTDGKSAKALDFNGVDGYVQIPQSSSLDVTAQVTVETWVYLRAYVDSTGMNSHLVSRSDSSGGPLYVLATFANGKINYDAGPFSGYHSSVATLPLNSWTHLAMTYNGASVCLYINGVLDSNYAQSGSIPTTSNWLAIGCKPTAPSGGPGTYAYTNGTIDEVRIYNRALTQQEIRTVMDLPTSPNNRYAWPMFHQNLKHAGFTESPAPNTNQSLWNYTTGSYVESSPAVADGRVYVGSDDGRVYCLDAANGAQVWNYTTGFWVRSSPAVADGRVYMGSLDCRVYCLDASTGAQVWNYTTGGYVYSSPAVAEGVVYVGSNDSNVYAFGKVVRTEDYASVQAAVDAATAGATVWVAPGTYSESLIVNKTIAIIGEKGCDPIFGGGGSGIAITLLKGASGSTVTGIVCTAWDQGVLIQNSVDCKIYGNSICLMGSSAIVLEGSSGNVISENTISQNAGGINLTGSDNNRIFHNNFVGNTVQLSVQSSTGNLWDDGYPSGGNYWSNHTGLDLYSGPNQDQPGSDGIVDAGYTVATGNVDRYPLVHGVHEIGIVHAAVSKTVVGRGCSLSVELEISDYGFYDEDFTVTVYTNTSIAVTRNIAVAAGEAVNVTLTLETTYCAYGNYTVNVYAWPVLDEANVLDNNFTGGWVVVAGVGDLTGGTPNALDFVPDGKVQIVDIAVVARYFGQKVPPAPPNCDVSGTTIGVPDGKIDITDVATVAKHFGEHYP